MAKISETEVLKMAGAMVLAQKEKGVVVQWGLPQHIGLLRRVVQALHASKATEGEICETLDQHGLGGNASQFRQWLNDQDGVTKGAFPAKAVSLKTYA